MFDQNRRIAQGQSASKDTEEAAAFDSCSAYQTLPEILFLSHCVPNPPDKGERIRAYHEIKTLAERFRVHLVCFANHASELEHLAGLRDICESVHARLLSPYHSLARAAVRFGLGRSVTVSYYDVPDVKAYVERIRRTRNLAATFCYSAAVAQFAPEGIPVFLDFVDIDSEKWFQYAAVRQPSFAFRAEGRRLRSIECELASRADLSILTTAQETNLLRSFQPDVHAAVLENGVDCEYFDPRQPYPDAKLNGRKFIVFTGVMSYFPNVQAVRAFAAEVFPSLRRADPSLEFLIVGRNPSAAVQKLGKQQGIVVTGGVPDIRPYLSHSAAVVVPLEIARGIQNKVLEALAMGKEVFCSPAVCATFGDLLPPGTTRCDTPAEFIAKLSRHKLQPGSWSKDIREGARKRFSWTRNLQILTSAMETKTGSKRAVAVSL